MIHASAGAQARIAGEAVRDQQVKHSPGLTAARPRSQPESLCKGGAFQTSLNPREAAPRLPQLPRFRWEPIAAKSSLVCIFKVMHTTGSRLDHDWFFDKA
ncbi:hypothetical protein WJX73_008454 [Symbiochloris irregularis]|uniref:Uncharacterized protein n=1 Tax=Symbiochloris irregularis TaxID=706552 RepID=A0AAW1P1K9_9CHLO